MDLTQSTERLEAELIIPSPYNFENGNIPHSSTASLPLELEDNFRQKRDTRPPTWLKDYYVH